MGKLFGEYQITVANLKNGGRKVYDIRLDEKRSIRAAEANAVPENRSDTTGAYTNASVGIKSQNNENVNKKLSLKETSIVDKIYSELQSIQEKKTEFWNDPEYNKAKERLNFANGITEKVEARRALRALENERGYTALVERESESTRTRKACSRHRHLC